MNHVPDVAKDMAKVATGLGLVVAESISRLMIRDFSSFALQTLKELRFNAARIAGLNVKHHVDDDFVSSEAEFQALRRVRGRRKPNHISSPPPPRRSVHHAGVLQNLQKNQGRQKKTDPERSGEEDSQPEELFAPKKAEASRELKPFTFQADSLSQKVALPSDDLRLVQKKLE